MDVRLLSSLEEAFGLFSRACATRPWVWPHFAIQPCIDSPTNTMATNMLGNGSDNLLDARIEVSSVVTSLFTARKTGGSVVRRREPADEVPSNSLWLCTDSSPYSKLIYCQPHAAQRGHGRRRHPSDLGHHPRSAPTIQVLMVRHRAH